MLSGGIEDAVDEVALAPTWASGSQRNVRLDWKAVDRALRSIRRRRAALDAEEARWLRAAEGLQIWRPLGMVSMLDYLERVLGYAPRTAQDRLRVARALGDLPLLEGTLSAGELPFSAVRELTRVATRATEVSWITAATGKNLRQIEELIADHQPGDRPDDPPSPEARRHVVRFELSAGTFAVLRQARSVLDDEHGTNLPDDGFIAALCGGVLDGVRGGEPTGRAKFQIAVTVCQRCPPGLAGGRRCAGRDRSCRGRTRTVRCPAHRLDRRRRTGAGAPGHSAERRALRVAPRWWPLPRGWLSLVPWAGALSFDPSC